MSYGVRTACKIILKMFVAWAVVMAVAYLIRRYLPGMRNMLREICGFLKNAWTELWNSQTFIYK